MKIVLITKSGATAVTEITFNGVLFSVYCEHTGDDGDSYTMGGCSTDGLTEAIRDLQRRLEEEAS